jgi:hypothetical protein
MTDPDPDPDPTASRPAPTWRPGVAFHHEKFYHFEARSAVVMRLWSEMRAWRRTPHTPWSHTRRWADEVLCRAPLRPGQIEAIAARRHGLVGPLSPDQYLDHHFRDSAAWGRALATIPDRMRQIASRFNDRRWHVLSMMARCPGTDDLLEANPALGFALASPWVLHQPAVRQPMRAIRALSNRKQVRIQEWLGLPATERVRRILRRIDPVAMTGRLLPQLRRGLGDDVVTGLLAHLPCISEEVLRWVLWEQTRRAVTPAFLHELAAVAPFDSSVLILPDAIATVPIARDVLAAPGDGADSPLAPTLETPAPYLRLWMDGCNKSAWLGLAQPSPLRSVAQLRRWHREVDEAMLQHHLERCSLPSDTEWAAPPWPGTASIQPLATALDLHEEGCALQHCVEAYSGLVASGDYAAYRVLEPVRATLGLHRPAGDWVVHQLQAGPGIDVPKELKAEIIRTLTGGALALGTA